jgi:hypothetical protein
MCGRNCDQEMKNRYSVFRTKLTIFAERHNICGNIFGKSVLGGRLMLASLSTPDWGKRLRAERERLRLSLRDVETLSRTIAKDRQDSNYYIAHASLADIENGKLTPPFTSFTASVSFMDLTTTDWRSFPGSGS